MVRSMDQMLVVDYLIANEDRHLNNFGLLRNPDTLEWIGAAPIFDSGSCLGYDKRANLIISGWGAECKPFKKTHEDQLKLVSSFDWIDFTKLEGIEEEIREILKDAGETIDEERKRAIVLAVKKRIERLKQMAEEESKSIKEAAFDKTEDDVAEDVARKYMELGFQ